MTGRRSWWWTPALVALATALVGWGALLAHHDAFATRTLAAVVLLSLLAPFPLWARARSGTGFVVAAAPKLAATYVLALNGLATFGVDVAAVRGDYALWHRQLASLWLLPAVLVVATAVEGWVVAARLKGQSFSDTFPGRHKAAAVTLVGVLAAGGALGARYSTRYQLLRLQAGYQTGRDGLRRIGQSAEPAVLGELHRVGTAPVGQYRSDLVNVLVDLRYDLVAARIGSRLRKNVAVASVDADEPMADALSAALVGEPEREQRRRMFQAFRDLDFNMAAGIICSTLPKLPRDGQSPMLDEFARRTPNKSRVIIQVRGSADSGPGASALDVEHNWKRLRPKLACAVPSVLTAFEREAPAWLGYDPTPVPGWARRAAYALVAYRPLAPAENARLAALLPRLHSVEFVSIVLDNFGTDLAGGDRRKMLALLESTFLHIDPGIRHGVTGWVRTEGSKNGIPPSALFCDLFDKANNGREELAFMIEESDDTDPCVAAVLMSDYASEQGSSDLGRWSFEALNVLEKRAAKDPRIKPWARRMLPKADGSDQKKLAKIAGVEPPAN